jgi:hypothetical protein
MRHWLERNIVEPGKLPLLLMFAAFVLTFATTRTITRMIRAGRGPFKDNVSSSGTHVHHAVPGIILLVTGAFLSIGAPIGHPWREIAAVLIGIGTSLVLDEFALILHLSDVYWTDEGRVSVEMISLAFGCLGFALVGSTPFGVNDVGTAELGFRLGAVATVLVTAAFVVVCVLKGKYRLALFGAFFPPFAWVGAVRLARPTSRWAKSRYAPERLAAASARTERFDARWDPLLDRFSDLIAGRPSQPDPPTTAS